MNKKYRLIAEKIIAFILVSLVILQTIAGAITYSKADYAGQLGGHKALGSPILNTNFVADDWNKWEMITWGVFLSNFATPMLDDYYSAFNSNSKRGSKGSGYKALQFGSGSDPENAEVLQSLLDSAITFQKNGQLKDIWVKHTEVDGHKGIVDNTHKEGEEEIADDGSYRQASLQDFIFQAKETDGDTFLKVSDLDGKMNLGAKLFGVNFGYKDIYTFDKGKLPTFSVKDVNNRHETVFDYTNSWDVQLLNAWFGRLLAGDLADDFAKELNKMWEEADKIPVYLDCFGNIVVKYQDSNRIMIPAAANQHLTDSPKINLINSLIFNGQMSSVNSKNLMLTGQQATWDSWGWIAGKGDKGGKPDKSGIPAFGSRINRVKPGTVNIYYDLDNIIIQDLLKGGYSEGKADVHYGKKVKALMDTDLETLTGEYTPKIEISNLADTKIDKLDSSIQSAIEQTALASTMISNVTTKNSTALVLNEVMTQKNKIKLLKDPVLVPVQADVGLDKTKVNTAGAARMYPNYLMKVYMGQIDDTISGSLNSKMVTDMLNSSKTVTDFRKKALTGENGSISYLAAGYIANSTDLFKLSLNSPNTLMKIKAPKETKFFKDISTVKHNGKKVIETKYVTGGDEDAVFQRLVKSYPANETMLNISNILGTRDGSDFAQWSTFIYMTYLDWYGIELKKELGKEPIMSHDFNTRIFDDKSDVVNVDITSIADIKTEEDKKKDVLDYTYLMLHPTEGREYRTNIIMSGMSDWVYKNYNNIVFGNASTYYAKNNANLATRNATGFLSIDSYSENMFTKWFMDIYAKIAVTVIAAVILAVLIMGILKSKKMSWFLITIAIAINSILIIPSTGEIVPFVTNKWVQKMFNGNMEYWSIAESVSNINMEKKLIDSINVGNATEEEANIIKGMVKTLNLTYLDRALMLKNDISRKITESSSGNFEAIQTMQSTRWMLPMLMRQFNSNDGTKDYVYIPMGDMYDDMSNLYWLYKPEDAATVQTVNADTGNANVYKGKGKILNNVNGIFPDYQKVDSYENSKWSSMSYYTSDGTTDELRNKDSKDIIHSYSYLLENGYQLLSRKEGFGGSYKGPESYDKYVDNTIANIGAGTYTGLSSELEGIAGAYTRSDRNTVNQKYGYLWATENPGHYFYQNVKDTFQVSDTLGTIVGRLQGTHTVQDDGTEVRKSFMHSYDTGNVRDVADLEGLFRNTVPYLYQMMLATGGTDGTSGLLGDSKIAGYNLYKDNYKSWMYRSNWAVKLVENKAYNSPDTVKDTNGKKYDVANPLMPDEYPTARPMVFSEAQMFEQGLMEDALTLVELKCIEINKKIARKWTTSLNYANTNGMTKEVMMRKMSTDSLIEFNKEFSPSTLLSGSKAMYPNGIDLRAISFDSVMKMLMINITKDVTYIQGDTMKSVVEDSDIFTAMLLLTSAFLCCYIIPLFRNVVLAAIFYLGLFSIVRAIVGNNNSKSKISLGYIISNLLFLVTTLVYYGVFSGLMRITTADEVLTVQSVQVNVGNPVWVFIVIIVISSTYVWAMVKMLNHCFKNFRDMGFEVYSEILRTATSGIADGIDNLTGKVSSWGSGEYSGVSGGGSVSGYGGRSGGTSKVNVSEGNINAEIKNDIEYYNSKDDANYKDYESSNYSYYDEKELDNKEVEVIDREIERGKNM